MAKLPLNFDEELKSLPVSGLAHYYDNWVNSRDASIKRLQIGTRAIDIHLLEVVVSAVLNLNKEYFLPEIEKMSPGFSKRLKDYVTVRTQLLHDLTKVNRELTKDVHPFNEWLQNL